MTPNEIKGLAATLTRDPFLLADLLLELSNLEGNKAEMCRIVDDTVRANFHATLAVKLLELRNVHFTKG